MTMEISKGRPEIDLAWYSNDFRDKLARTLLGDASKDDSTSSPRLCYSNRSPGRSDRGKPLLNVKTASRFSHRKALFTPRSLASGFLDS